MTKLILFAAATMLAQATTVTFTANGTWTVPSGVSGSIIFECWGPGGSGGNQNNTAYGGGGGGAQYAKSSFSPSAGTNVSITFGTFINGFNSTRMDVTGFGTVACAQGEQGPDGYCDDWGCSNASRGGYGGGVQGGGQGQVLQSGQNGTSTGLSSCGGSSPNGGAQKCNSGPGNAPGGGCGVAGCTPGRSEARITYTINNTPSLVSVSGIPANINYGNWVYVVATVRDPDGWSNINYWHLLINYGVDGNGACYFQFFPNSNNFYLINDSGSAFQGPWTMGTSAYPSNRACIVDVPGSYYSNSGTDSTVYIRVQFKPDLLSRPPLNSYLYVVDVAGAAAGWGGSYNTGTLRSGPKTSVHTSQ